LTVPAEPDPQHSHIAGRVLPIKAAEELLATLTGVVSVRIAVNAGASEIDAVHVLTTDAVSPKATVRNVESALMAHFGLRVDHRKVSVATTQDTARQALRAMPSAGTLPELAVAVPPPPGPAGVPLRRLYFEDVEVRRSRTRGVTCRVTLKKGEASFVGEAEGMEHDRAWIELAAQATMAAIAQAEGDLSLGVYGVKLLEAFDRTFVFVGVTARVGRESMLLTGSCEVRDSAETSSALAVLDATNRYLAQLK
jgi:hypothetical protein